MTIRSPGHGSSESYLVASTTEVFYAVAWTSEVSYPFLFPEESLHLTYLICGDERLATTNLFLVGIVVSSSWTDVFYENFVFSTWIDVVESP